jgi:predicted pyridoxine 5'-phosphate oxidase superfamily flavin-nucleotide-binding protein
MSRAFTRLSFSPAVKDAQARYGAREHGRRIENKEPANDRLTEDLKAFIASAASFFIGSASREGWPHVQHRGGPAGFLRVLDDRTLAFADYAGNKQYITVGNLTENDRVLLLLIDFEHGRRLKVWGRGAVIDNDPVLIERVRDPAYPAEIERAIRIDVKAWDFNCRRHLPKFVPQQHVDRMISDCDARVASLQARYDDLLAIMYAHE